MATTYAYLRVSTDAQDHASQRQQIDTYLKARGLTLAGIVADEVSGACPWQQRSLGKMLENIPPGSTIIVSEISRIARSTVGVLTFLQEAVKHEINVVAVRNGIAIDGSLQSKITVTILALVAEIERDLLRERTKAALDARKAAGLPHGRPAGSQSPSILESRAKEIDRLIASKVSKSAIARVLGCSRQTLYNFLDRRPAPEEHRAAGQLEQ